MKTHAGEMTAATLQTAAADALPTVISSMAPSRQRTPGVPQEIILDKNLSIIIIFLK
jgi:hypothetical protein